MRSSGPVAPPCETTWTDSSPKTSELWALFGGAAAGHGADGEQPVRPGWRRRTVCRSPCLRASPSLCTRLVTRSCSISMGVCWARWAPRHPWRSSRSRRHETRGSLPDARTASRDSGLTPCFKTSPRSDIFSYRTSCPIRTTVPFFSAGGSANRWSGSGARSKASVDRQSAAAIAARWHASSALCRRWPGRSVPWLT